MKTPRRKLNYIPTKEELTTIGVKWIILKAKNEKKALDLPKHISYRKDNNQYRVRVGSSGKIDLGSLGVK